MSTTTVPQWRTALDRGNHIRLANAALKRQLRGMTHDEALEQVAGLLDNPPEHVGVMSIGQLLMSIPEVGDTKTDVLVREINGRSRDRKVKQLTDRQRTELADLLRDRGWRCEVVNYRAWAREKGLVA